LNQIYNKRNGEHQLSSILRALKKLENEPRHQEESKYLENQFVPSAEIGAQPPVSSIFIMVIGGGFVCGLVILAGWWLFSENFQTRPVVPASVPQVQKSPASLQNFNKEPIPATEEKIFLKTPEEQKATVQTREAEPTGLEKPVVEVISQEDVLSAEKQTPEEVSQVQEISNLKENEAVTKPAEKPLMASAGTKEIPTATVKIEVPKLDDPGIKLQAVTWSRTPQKRIAVINNRILREGDMVSGYLINIINQDDVVISRDAEKWKITFH
jgi:hypothetical protein